MVPFIALLLPPEIFLGGGETICISKRLFDIECFGCGMTRAVVALLNGDFEAAYNFNWRIVIVAPLLVAEYLRRLTQKYRLYKLYYAGLYAGRK